MQENAVRRDELRKLRQWEGEAPAEPKEWKKSAGFVASLLISELFQYQVFDSTLNTYPVLARQPLAEAGDWPSVRIFACSRLVRKRRTIMC